MPTTTVRAGLRSPLGTEANDVVTDMAHLAQDVDDIFAMCQQGLISARPSATKQRRFYYATDDRGGKLFYDTGSAWQEIGPGPIAGPVTGWTAKAVSAASAALGDVTLGVYPKTSQTGDIFVVGDVATTAKYMSVSVAGLISATKTIQSRVASGGTSFDSSDSVNSSLRVSHPSAGVARLDVDSGNSLQISVAGSAKYTFASTGVLTVTDRVDLSAGSGLVTFFANATQASALPASRMGIGYDGTQLNLWDGIGAKGFRFYDTINAASRFSVSGAGVATMPGGFASSTTSSIDLFGTGRNLNFRPALADSGANMGIVAADWNGDSNFDGLRFNSNDGLGVYTAFGRTAHFDRAGSFFAGGSDSYFGNNSFSGTGGRLHVQTDTGPNVYLKSENSATSSSMIFMLKGTGGFFWQDTTPTTLMTLSNTGVLTTTAGITASTGNIATTNGSMTATGGGLYSSAPGGVARLYTKATDAAVDAKVWDMTPSGNTLLFRTLNDLENSSNAWMTVTRSGYNPSNIAFGTSISQPSGTAQLGALTITAGGLQVTGSPSGYNDEIKFMNVGSGAVAAITSFSTGSPTMGWDFRGTSNAGSWFWRNGTNASVTRMSLSATGQLATGSSVTAPATGTNNTAFADNDNHSWEADGAGGWRFRNSWNSAGAIYRFYGGTGTTEMMRIADGSTYIHGNHHRLGMGVFGVSGSYLNVYADTGASDVWVYAKDQNDTINRNLFLRASTVGIYDAPGTLVAGFKDSSYGGTQSTPLFLYANGSYQQVIQRSGLSIRSGFADTYQFLMTS